MGTTESLFYDDDGTGGEVPAFPSDAVEPQQLQPSSEEDRHHRHVSAASSEGRRPSAVAGRRKMAPGNTSTNLSPQPDHGGVQQRRMVSPGGRNGASGGGGGGKPIKRLHGCVSGASKTGKRSLLQRLQGRDPFASNSSDESVPSFIMVPYRPPPGCPTWDRILLCVFEDGLDNSDEASSDHGGSHNLQDGKSAKQPQKLHYKADFVVVLINPQDDVEVTKSYLQKTLATLLLRSGYTASEREKTQDTTMSSTDASATSSVKDPVCVCFLWNFRDRMVDDDDEGKKVVATKRRQLENYVKLTLESSNVPLTSVVVTWIDTSLKNCYGLDRLHHYIYRTYLQRRKHDLEQQLRDVQNGIDAADDNETNSESAPISYEEFLKVIAPPHPPLNEKKHRDKNRGPDSSESDDTRIVQNTSKQRPKSYRKVGILSTTLKEPKKQQTRMGKEALEAFLASSSDEEDPEKPSIRGKGKKLIHDEDKDEDDDDYFYDEGGKRRFNHLTNRNVSTVESSSSSDESHDTHGVPVEKASEPARPDPSLSTTTTDVVYARHDFIDEDTPKEQTESDVPKNPDEEGEEEEADTRALKKNIEDEEESTSEIPSPSEKPLGEGETTDDLDSPVKFPENDDENEAPQGTDESVSVMEEEAEGNDDDHIIKTAPVMDFPVNAPGNDQEDEAPQGRGESVSRVDDAKEEDDDDDFIIGTAPVVEDESEEAVEKQDPIGHEQEPDSQSVKSHADVSNNTSTVSMIPSVDDQPKLQQPSAPSSISSAGLSAAALAAIEAAQKEAVAMLQPRSDADHKEMKKKSKKKDKDERKRKKEKKKKKSKDTDEG